MNTQADSSVPTSAEKGRPPSRSRDQTEPPSPDREADRLDTDHGTRTADLARVWASDHRMVSPRSPRAPSRLRHLWKAVARD
jgi:hypothetical protein